MPDSHAMIDDNLERLLCDANPVPGHDLADSYSAAADKILAAAIGQTRRNDNARRLVPRQPRLIAAVAALALAAIATAATYSWVVSWHGHAGTSDTVDCVFSDQADAHIALDARTENPVEACRRAWPRLFGASAPESLTACVDGSPQGSIQVYQGRPGVCEANNASTYRGATAEQQRLVDFRDNLAAQLPEHGCVSYRTLERIVERTLAEHSLHGWSITNYKNTDVAPRTGRCANVAFIDESKQNIVLITGLAETIRDY